MNADGRGLIADLIGRRKRIRTAPIPAWTKAVIKNVVRKTTTTTISQTRNRASNCTSAGITRSDVRGETAGRISINLTHFGTSIHGFPLLRAA
jgi:hypothetical protein